MTEKKELLFSLTEKDFEFTYSMGTGPGGQKRNKTASKVRCYHPPSGADGVSDETRSQHQNKKLAFEKMAKSKKFQDWLKIEIARRSGKLIEIEERVDRAMNPSNIKVEVKDENGRWVDWKDEQIR